MKRGAIDVDNIEFVIYGTKYISENKFLVGGGGGKDIPNKISIYESKGTGDTQKSVVGLEYKVVDELNTGDDIIWHFDVNLKTRVVAISNVTNVFFVRYDENMTSIKRMKCKYIDVYTDEDRPNKKYCYWRKDGQRLYVTDDNGIIHIYKVDVNDSEQSIEWEEVSKIEASKEITDICPVTIITKEGDKHIESNFLVSTSEEKKICFWNTSTNEKIGEFDIPFKSTLKRHQFKSIKTSNDGKTVFAMHTGMSGPSYLSSYIIEESEDGKSPLVKYISSKKFHNKPCTSTSISYVKNHNDLFYFSFGINDGILICDKHLNKCLEIPKIHSCPVSANDILPTIFSKEGELLKIRIDGLSGSIDKTFGCYSAVVNTSKYSLMRIFLFLLSVLVIFVSIYLSISK